MPNRRDIIAAAAAIGLTPGMVWAQDANEYDLQWSAVFGATSERVAAQQAIIARANPDLAAGLILEMRFVDVDAEIVPVLRAITGDSSATTWFDWMLWQQAHPEVRPHVSYIEIMRSLHLRIDENFAPFLRPEFLAADRARIRVEEITWGGVVKDGIPSLDNPTLIMAEQADYLRDDDLVFGLSVNGDVRAYPLRIMGWHEMFNDVIGGVPLALAYCTLCGSGILFETLVAGRAQPFSFGSSGFLYRSNKLMYDRETLTLWNQFTGEPVVGPLADSGVVLVQRPVVITPWGDWRRANPATQVLSLDTGFQRDYGSGVVYNDYFASPDLMFPALVDQRAQLQKDYVFGIRRFGGAKAWPIEVFDGGRVINDAVAGYPVVLIGDAAGRTVRAYGRDQRRFALAENGLVADDGSQWQITEEALIGPGESRLPREAGHIAYWFAWNGYLGAESEIYVE